MASGVSQSCQRQEDTGTGCNEKPTFISRRKFGIQFVKALKDKYCNADDYSCTSGFVIDIVVRGKPRDSAGAELGNLRNVVRNFWGFHI